MFMTEFFLIPISGGCTNFVRALGVSVADNNYDLLFTSIISNFLGGALGCLVGSALLSNDVKCLKYNRNKKRNIEELEDGE